MKWCCYASSPARAARQIQAKIPRFTCTAKVALHPSAQVASKRLRKELEEGHEKEIGSKLQPSAQVASERLRKELEETKCKGHEIDDICLEETTLDSGGDDSEG